MSAREISLHRIETAIDIADRYVEFYRQNARGIDAHRDARINGELIAEAKREFRKLSEAWPRARSLMQEADRAYDRRVLSGGQSFDDGPGDCCSCHINPPCSFCTSQVDEEEE